jgi:MoaA/NifB/PqqE/SkfB family radical SAM enzyme
MLKQGLLKFKKASSLLFWHFILLTFRKHRLRNIMFELLDKYVKKTTLENPSLANTPPRIREEKYLVSSALLASLQRAFDKEFFAPRVAQKLVNILIGGLIIERAKKSREENFLQEQGFRPPLFLTISPEKRCQLRCKDCYAGSTSVSCSLPYSIFSRIISEAKTLWGTRFFVISGGEPLLYNDENKGILEIVEENSDCIFLMYTNGLLITREVAHRLAETGNLTPAISVEGLERKTDARRGKGCFSKIIKVMSLLREEGVPFGISVTATQENADEILSDEFLEFFFIEQGALYGWLFQYMPIGRKAAPELMVSPEQRVKMWKRSWEIIKDRKIFYIDFWNHGTVSGGCISGARPGGYLYIDWSGNVFPCVFVPYSPVNIKELFAKGGSLNTLISEPFFKSIRDWQKDYGYDKQTLSASQNWLRPCIMRDHYQEFKKLVTEHAPQPGDETAKEALRDDRYCQEMIEFDKKMAELTNPIWQQEYLKQEKEDH